MGINRSSLSRRRNSVNAEKSSDNAEPSSVKNPPSVEFYYGTDVDTNCTQNAQTNELYIKITRKLNKPNELVLFLRLDDGRIFVLPDYPNAIIKEFHPSSCSCADLNIGESLKRTHITYNGLLSDSNQHNDDIDASTHHIRLNCTFDADAVYSSEMPPTPWYKFGRKPSVERADQYGVFTVEVMLEDGSAKRLFLRGLRHREWGKLDAESVYIMGVDKANNVFNLKIDKCQRKPHGHIKSPDGNLSFIDSLDLDVNAVKSLELHEREYQFCLLADNKRQSASLKLRSNSSSITFYGGDPYKCQYTYNQLELNVNGVHGVGILEVVQAVKRSSYIPKTTMDWYQYKNICSHQTVSTKNSENLENLYVLPLVNNHCKLIDCIGEKGASLASLAAICTTDFAVPKGFCVTVKAFQDHIKFHNDLSILINNLVSVCNGKVDGDIKECSQKLVAEIRKTPMAKSVEESVKRMLTNFEQDHDASENPVLFVVMRSELVQNVYQKSATKRKLDKLAVTSDLVINQITDCWADLYSYENVEYRRKHGQAIGVFMAVCVQRMVDADSSGVLFTRDPISGNPKDMVIASTHGSAENFSYRDGDADTIIIRRKLQGTLSIKSVAMGQKKVVVNNYGFAGIEYADENAQLSISEELALKIAEIGLKLDRAFKGPREIKWAITKGQIFVLRCQEIKSLKVWRNFELPQALNESTIPSPVSVNGNTIFEGRVTGRACVVLNLKGAQDIKHKDILITKTLDEYWKPYMSQLAGIVTEMNLTSRSVRLVYECKIPCIIGARTATTTFTTGDIVILDADHGTVRVLN